MNKPMKMPLRRHRDDDYHDMIVVNAGDAIVGATITPRFKTSGMSGDEWRITAKLSVLYKGNHILDQYFNRMRMLTSNASHFLWTGARHLLGLGVATMVVYRKGVVIMKQEFPTLGDAAMGIGWHIITASEGSKKTKWHHLTDEQEYAHCQQVGCSLPTKNFYRLEMLQEGDELIKPKYDFTGQFTWFCGRHTERGDAGREDCDKNMVLVAGDGKADPDADDESPAVFVGVIDMSGSEL